MILLFPSAGLKFHVNHVFHHLFWYRILLIQNYVIHHLWQALSISWKGIKIIQKFQHTIELVTDIFQFYMQELEIIVVIYFLIYI